MLLLNKPLEQDLAPPRVRAVLEYRIYRVDRPRWNPPTEPVRFMVAVTQYGNPNQ